MTISKPENQNSSNSPPTLNNSIQLSDGAQQTSSETESIINNLAKTDSYNINHSKAFVQTMKIESFVSKNQV